MAIILLVIIVAVSWWGFGSGRAYFNQLTCHPYSIVHQKKWYMLLTSGFLHADLNHLIFNALSYFFFALPLERMIGSEAFLLVFLGSMVISDLPTVYKHRNDPGYRSLGASGGVTGVIFSYILFDPNSKIYLFLIPIGIPAFIFAILYLAYSFYAERNGQDYINHSAHIWGGVSGAAITIAMFPGVLPLFFQQIF